MKATVIIINCLLIICQGCIAFRSETLETSWIDLRVSYPVENKKSEMNIKGQVMMSAYGITRIHAQIEERCLLITVNLGPTWLGVHGNLNHTFVVPDSITEVRFGSERTLIWSKERGVNPEFAGDDGKVFNGFRQSHEIPLRHGAELQN